MGTSSISTLATYVGLERTTLVRTLKPLLECGFIQDASEPGTRDRKLYLTETGKAKLDEGHVLWEEAQQEVEERLGAEESQWIYHLAEKL